MNMDHSEIISIFCLTLSGLPTDADPKSLSLFKGAICSQLIHTASGDKKWLLLFKSKNVVRSYLARPHFDIEINNQVYELKIEQSAPCDIPVEWCNQEILSRLQQFRGASPYYPHQQPQGNFPQKQYGHPRSTIQGQPRQMYPGSYYQNSYVPHQYQYFMHGQGHYPNGQYYQHGGAMFYEDPRYYHSGMYGNYWQPNLQNNPQQINATPPYQWASTAQNNTNIALNNVQTSPNTPHEATIQQTQKTLASQHDATTAQDQTNPVDPCDSSTPQNISVNEKGLEENPENCAHLNKEQDPLTPVNKKPIPLAPWEVTAEEKGFAVMKIQKDADSKTEITATIKLSNLPTSTTADSLRLFFENRRKSGGGPIQEVDFDKSDYTAIITFQDQDSVGRVLQKLPILFENKQIKVDPFYPGGRERENTNASNNMDDEQNSVRTIEIHGVQPKTTDDTVEFYFENTRRSGGGDVKYMKREENIIFITFKEVEVVQRVLAQKKHKIDGSELIVKQYIPPPRPKPRPMYEDRVCITGMNPKTSDVCLSNFLKTKFSISPSEILYGEEEGTAVVTFEKKPDIGKLIAVCKRRPLEKHYLTISRVPVTNCILISGLDEKTSKDTLEFYFENTKRSGGGEIEKVEMIEDDNICLIYFSDISVLENVCRKNHIIDGKKLKVLIYYECLGQVDIDEDQEASSYPSGKFKVPDPLIISDLNPRKLNFVQNSENVKTSLDKQLSTCHASIEWPTKKHDPLKITCTLSTNVKKYKKLAKSWKKSTTEILDQFVNSVGIEKIDILQEAWDLVLDGLKSLNVAHPDGVAISIEQSTKEIFIVGYRNIIPVVSQQVRNIIDEVTKELERRKKQVTEIIKVDKTHQLRILLLSQFPNKMADKFEGLKVNIKLKKNEITYEGLTGDITKAKSEMDSLFQNIVSANVGKFSEAKLKFLESAAVREFISSRLKEDQVMAVWEIDAQKNVFMYSLSDDEGVKGAHILKDAIVETPVSLKEEALCLLQSQKWQTTKSEIEKRAPGLIIIIPEIDKSQVLISTVSKYAGVVRELIEDFLHENTIYEKHLSVTPGQMRFLLQHRKVDMENIAKELQEHQVTIIMDHVILRIKGTSHGLHQAMTKIDRIVNTIKQKTHLMKKSSMVKYLLSEGGQESIKKVEKTKICVIESEPCFSSSSHDDEFEIIEKFDKSAHQDLATCVTSGGQRIIVKKGDITELDVDVLVNASNKDLKHIGGLAKAIVQKGGMSIQEECNAFIRKHHDNLYEGDIYCSSPGNLKCKLIVHAVGPIWQGGEQNEAELLQEVVLKSLEESEKRGYKSIAIPALCSGIFGYPVSQATKVITESIYDFFQENIHACVKDVFLCDINDDNVENFVKGLIKSFGKDNVQQQDKKISSTAWTTPSLVTGKYLSIGTATKLCKINIKIVKGTIARQKVDVIVNTVARDLNLAQGAVSASLLKYGGQSLQDECSAKYPKGIQFGDVAVTSGGNLQCSKVLHGSLPSWDDGKMALEALRIFVYKCLSRTSLKGLASVAFPALGTGNLGYPKDVVAKEMFQCVNNFSSSNSSSSITEVIFVLFDKDIQTIQAFEDEEKRHQSDGGGSHSHRKGRKFGVAGTPKQKSHGLTSNESKNEIKTAGREKGNNTLLYQLPNSAKPEAVKLKIYANEEKTHNAARDMIEEECEKAITTKLVEDKIIKEFSKEEEESVLELGKKYGFEVNLEKRIGRLRLTGLKEDFVHATTDLYAIIIQAERKKQHQQEAEIYAQFVKWHFIEITKDGNQLEEYPNDINLKLEMAYKNHDSYVKFFDDNSIEYTVDLNNLVEYPTVDPTDKVTVIRKDLVKDSTFEPPDTWDIMTDNLNSSVIVLKPQSSEYKQVTSNFLQQAGQFNIIKCERIQNRALYQQYVAKKKSIDAQNPPSVVNEKMLWHGTAGNAVDSINAYGFNRSYCGKNAVAIGNGVYFAAEASYSCRTTYSPPDLMRGHRHIYQCKVLTGEFTRGHEGMRVPPNKPPASGASSHILYDSVVNDVNKPEIFVIFNDTQAYPEYHITFT